jgi:Trypsin
MRKLLALLAALASTLVIGIVPAGAITNGEPDGERHPYVGLVTFYDSEGAYLWRCSATLISSTVLLTAGHCTEPPAVSAQVWFDAGPIEAGNYPLTPVEDRPPCTGYTGWPCTGGESMGTPYTHPRYDPHAFFRHDLGVVVLNEPVEMETYGVLPSEGQLSTLPKHATTTAVGYGLQRSLPPAAAWKNEGVRIRMLATPRIMGYVSDFAVYLSHDASRGGTCFGDSGGPIFIGDSNIVGAVTSFGQTYTCHGPNGAYRVDQPDDLAWLATFGLTPGT